MKKMIFILFLILQQVTFGQENQDIPKEVKDQLLTMMVPHLRNFIEKWGTYKAGTTITEVNQLEENQVEIRGMVNYEADQCGSVEAKYKFTVISEGDYKTFEICVYCPYCFLGSVLKYEWDCKGKKNMDAGDYLQVISKMNAASQGR
jgi:hypothetical protein